METRHHRQVSVETRLRVDRRGRGPLELGVRRRGPGAGAARAAGGARRRRGLRAGRALLPGRDLSAGPGGPASALRGVARRPSGWWPRPATSSLRRTARSSDPRGCCSRPRTQGRGPPRGGAVALIPIDGGQGEGGGQVLRAALTLSAATGQGFEITKIRARRARPGLAPQHVAAVRAAALACGARTGGLFEGSPDLRFEPGAAAGGEFRFEIGTAGATTLVRADRAPHPGPGPGREPRWRCREAPTCPAAPPSPILARHWAAVVARLGLRTRHTLVRAGFYPRGGGELRSQVEPWTRPGAALVLENRGRLLAVRGESLAAKLKTDVAQRQREAVLARLWEARRLEAEILVSESRGREPGQPSSTSRPSSRRAAPPSAGWGRRACGPRSWATGRRGACCASSRTRRPRRWTRNWPTSSWCRCACPAGGGRVTTGEVTTHLETVAQVATAFGFTVHGDRQGRDPGPPGGRFGVDPPPGRPLASPSPFPCSWPGRPA